jgi:hypothetical protein
MVKSAIVTKWGYNYVTYKACACVCVLGENELAVVSHVQCLVGEGQTSPTVFSFMVVFSQLKYEL